MDFTGFEVASFAYCEADYLAQNPDVKLTVSGNLLRSGFAHFSQHGFSEGRSPSGDYEILQAVLPLYNEANYLAQNPDVQGAIGRGQLTSGLEHFARSGFRERREPGGGFNRFNFGSESADSLTGGAGRDLLLGWNGDDQIQGLAGDDQLAGNRGRDLIFGNEGNDRLRGGKEADTLWGGAGDDQLLGDLGDDLLSGDLGADTLAGGAGADLFLISAVAGGSSIASADVILDFLQEGADRLVVPSGQRFEDLDFTAGIGVNSGDTIVRDRATGRYLAVLKGINPNSFSASNVISQESLNANTAILRFLGSGFVGNEQDRSAVITIERSGNLQTAAQATFSTGSGTATPNQDFTPVNSAIAFAPGETRKTISIPLTDDRLTETDETVALLLSNPVGAQLDRATATLIIRDGSGGSSSTNPTGPTVSLDGNSYSINETGGSLAIPVRRTGDLSQPLSVTYATSNGTALAGLDYSAINGQLTFAAGQSVANLTIPILNDSLAEPTETFQLNLSNPTGGQLGNINAATISIIDSAASGPSATTTPTSGPVQSSVASAVAFSPSDSEAAIAAKNGPKITLGNTNIYIGYQQVSALNQDPILVSFTNGVRNWVRTDYETTVDDGTGTGLAWDGSNLYAVFTSTGNQPGNNLSRFTGSGWLTGYTDGSPNGGGGGKVGILAKVDPTTGNIQNATYLTARNDKGTATLGDDTTNSLFVRGLSFTGGNVLVQADSAYAPRRPDKTAMTQSVGNGALPASTGYNYEVVLSANLGSALSTRAKDFI